MASCLVRFPLRLELGLARLDGIQAPRAQVAGSMSDGRVP